MKSTLFQESLQQLQFFCTAGVPLQDSLRILAQGVRQAVVRRVWAEIATRVACGDPLADACAAYPQYFHPFQIQMLALGERSGQLGALLTALIQYEQQEARLAGALRRTLSYPITVALMALAVACWIEQALLPEFAACMEVMGLPPVRVPSIYRGLLWGVGLAGFLVLLGVGGWLWKGTRAIQRVWDRVRLSKWCGGRWLQVRIVGRIIRVQALLLEAGVPLLEAVRLSAGLTQNRCYTEALYQIQADLIQGRSWVQSVAACGRFPPLVIQMIEVGVRSGRVVPCLACAAARLEEEWAQIGQWLLVGLPIVAFVLLGGLVGILLFQIYLPVLQWGGQGV